MARGSKVVDLSASVLLFLVTHVAYLISASWLPCIGLAIRMGGSIRLHENLRPQINRVVKEKKFGMGEFDAAMRSNPHN